MKVRVCLAELSLPHASHPVDLIETGAYENIRPHFLAVNPAGTVPVLVHRGHPVYESHEQIRYAADHAPPGSPSLVPEDPALREQMEAWIDRASLTEDPLAHGDVPGRKESPRASASRGLSGSERGDGSNGGLPAARWPPTPWRAAGACGRSRRTRRRRTG